MGAERICNNCSNCAYDVGSGLQCDLDYPKLKSVTEKTTCHYFNLDAESVIDGLQEENVDLHDKLAAAEKERDELRDKLDDALAKSLSLCQSIDAERAHNAVLWAALEAICHRCPVQQYLQGKCHCDSCLVQKSLSTTPLDSAANVQKLVDALEKVIKTYIIQHQTHVYDDCVCDTCMAIKAAQNALADWREK